MLNIEIEVSSIYSRLKKIFKIILMHYGLFEKLFAMDFNDVTLLETYWNLCT